MLKLSFRLQNRNCIATSSYYIKKSSTFPPKIILVQDAAKGGFLSISHLMPFYAKETQEAKSNIPI